MPDYASILKRSIETLPEKTPDMRQAVYERARSALARQLTSVDPPLSPESIELQHQHLEDAISVVEADYSPVTAATEETVDVAAANDEIHGDTAPPGETALPGDEEPAELAAGGEAPPAPDWDEPEPEGSAPPGEAQAEASNRRWERSRPSRAPAVIMLVLITLIAAGTAVFAYTQWDTVRAVMANLTGEPTVAEVPAADVPSADATAGGDEVVADAAGGGETAETPKTEDRLPGGVAAPPNGGPATQPVDAAPVDGAPAEPAADAGVREAAQDTVPDGAAPAEPDMAATEAPASQPPAAETGTETGAVDAVPQGLVGQRAIFEEQGADGAPGKSAPGVVAWSQRTRENGLPAIVGIIELPERNAAASITIAKNTDEALPASHLIEIEFRGAEGLVESPLERMPAIFLKQTAQSRGSRLIGEAVPVTEDLYWIALSDQSDQVSRNLALLREGAWFSLPMLFKNGRGALLSFEKGIPGDQVFEAVLAAWDKADAGQ